MKRFVIPRRPFMNGRVPALFQPKNNQPKTCMKQNKFLLAFAALASGVLVCHDAVASTLVVDQFSGYTTGDLGASGTGGTGLTPGWFNPTADVTVTNGSHSLDGTGLGLVSSAGDKVTISATSSVTVYNKFCNSGTFPQTVQTNIYFSFLYRFNVGTDVSPAGQVIAQVNRQNSGSVSDWFLIAQNAGGGNVQLGVAKPQGTATNFASTLIAPGQTVFVVVREQIIPGAGNDENDLWIDPPPNSFGASEADVPPVSATTTNGVEDASATGPGRFYVVSGANANLDELRITTTWAEATPPAGQCLTAGIINDPTNLSQVAEIQATFSATASGTSPNYQWQILKSGGSTFSNIVGANLSTYTTSNLSLATDNGNQYRMIVTVPCNSTAATSGVATITLTAPVPTAPGPIMDDTFSDQLRDNEPITTNNSVWRTETSADLSAFPGPGMVGTPESGSSSLWLGYFCSDTNPPVDPIADPVDLAVGTTLQVTMPFIPASYNSFTNNGSLRFGVYDYFDGGTYLTNDSAAAGGSTGNGTDVRGYMLSLDDGPTFSMNSPLQLLVRSAISDINLMGTTGDYVSMGSGPNGGGFSNAPAFAAGTEYTLVFSVARTDVNSCTVTTAISGGGTNWTFSATDTNYAYHRFDAFGIRPNSLETTADMFTFPEFIVQVIPNPVTSFSVSITQPTANSVVLTWPSVATASYSVQSTASLTTPSWSTITTVVASGTSTSYTNTPISGSSLFFRVVSP
jgi:hypothetical protein